MPQTLLPFDVVVSTCLEYAPRTLPALFDTMLAVGIPMASVHVVMGQCPRGVQIPKVVTPDGVQMTTVTYGAEALTSVVACARGDVKTTPWFLMIQDSCFVGPDFVKRATEVHDAICKSDNVDVVKLLDKFSLSIGFYRTAWLETKAEILGEVCIESFDVDSVRKLKTHIEDKAFDMASPARTVVLGRFDDPVDRAIVGNYKYLGSNTNRVVEHYKSLDLFKLKSWWGQCVPRYTTTTGDDLPQIPVGV